VRYAECHFAEYAILDGQMRQRLYLTELFQQIPEQKNLLYKPTNLINL
jgi:hypothetical protein